MKFTLVLLLLPWLALAAPSPAPAPDPDYYETETPGSGRTYNAIIGSDDPRTLDEIIAEMGFSRSDLRHTFENSAFRGFSVDLSGRSAGNISTASVFRTLSTTLGDAVFVPDTRIQMAGRKFGTWGQKRISQEGRVVIGNNNVKKPFFKHYVFEGERDDLGKGVNIYIVDTGVRSDHHGFGGRARLGYSFDGLEFEKNDTHGTHVAGIAASRIFGVAQGANIISVRVGPQDDIDVSDIILGISWMVQDHDTQKDLPEFRGSVASLALSVEGKSDDLDEVVKRASNANIHISIAAGNSNRNACNTSPSRVSKNSNAVTVGSINVNDERSSTSGYGSCVTVYAPGVDIVSLGVSTAAASKLSSGTSMASAHVSGLMAVLLVRFPELTTDPANLKKKIVEMARHVPMEEVPSKGGDPELVINNGNLIQELSVPKVLGQPGNGTQATVVDTSNFGGGLPGQIEPPYRLPTFKRKLEI